VTEVTPPLENTRFSSIFEYNRFMTPPLSSGLLFYYVGTPSVIADAMPPLPKGEAIALPDSTSADLGDALAPPLGELSKPSGFD
jgi:hypothetical protein